MPVVEEEDDIGSDSDLEGEGEGRIVAEPGCSDSYLEEGDIGLGGKDAAEEGLVKGLAEDVDEDAAASLQEYQSVDMHLVSAVVSVGFLLFSSCPQLFLLRHPPFPFFVASSLRPLHHRYPIYLFCRPSCLSHHTVSSSPCHANALFSCARFRQVPHGRESKCDIAVLRAQQPRPPNALFLPYFCSAG